MYFDELQKLLINLTNRNISYSDMALALGKDRSNITYKINNKRQVKDIELRKIAEYFSISLDRFTTNDVEEITTNESKVKVLGEVHASMGNGITVYDETQTGTYYISNKLAKELGIKLNNAVMIFASGDSMIPTIYGGDSLLVDTAKKDIYDGRIYCVRIDGQLYAKRLQKIPPNKIKVVSDNQEKYDSFYVDIDSTFDFDVIGEIRWWGRVAK